MKRELTSQDVPSGKGQPLDLQLGPAEYRGWQARGFWPLRISTERRFDRRTLDKCPRGSARVRATDVVSCFVQEGCRAAALSG